MRTIVILLLSLSLAPAIAHPQEAQAEIDSLDFPVEAFRQNEEVAIWIMRYDRCAWITSDAVLAQLTPALQSRLGTAWFCYEHGDDWRAIYGRYYPESDSLDVVFHFEMAPSGAVTRSEEVPPSFAVTFARALHAVGDRLPKAVIETGARFNQYVRMTPDGPEIWFLPAWQPNGWIIQGMELRYGFDAGGQVVRDSLVLLSKLRGSRPDSTLTFVIDAGDDEVPTVGQLFFALAYTKRFARVELRTRRFMTVYLIHGDHRAWIHRPHGVALPAEGGRP